MIGHSQFEKIPLSDERQKMYLQKQIDDVVAQTAALKAQRAENFTIKQMERMKKQLQRKLDKLNDQSRKDDVISFEELGVDSLMVDEAHYFKNAMVTTKMTRVAGISQTESQKASDMYMKCMYMDELTGGRGMNSVCHRYTDFQLDDRDVHHDAVSAIWALGAGGTAEL